MASRFRSMGVEFSFHPAGHIPGSAQIRVAHEGEVWVFSGDYKLENDGISEPFEPVKCHTFITESTFGLPVYKWRPQQEVFNDINQWWRKNQAAGKVTILAGYALGKSQRILKNIDPSIGKIFVHGAIDSLTQIFRKHDTGAASNDLCNKRDEKEGVRGCNGPLSAVSYWFVVAKKV